MAAAARGASSRASPHEAPTLPLGLVRHEAPTLPLAFARGAPFLALAAFGALHWMAMLAPAQPARGWQAVGVGALVMLGLLGAGRLRGVARAGACAAVLVCAFGLAALVSGAPDEILRPARWGQLAAGIDRGLSGLAGVRIPYQGVDAWTAFVIAFGGTLLVVAAATAAFWPRRSGFGFPLAAAALLLTLYVTAATAIVFEGAFLRGAVLALLLLAFLVLERVRVPDAGAAAVAGLAVALAGLLVAPLLDGRRAWWDVESWALTAAEGRETAFTWDHDYGALKWPREGRELLRVRARRGSYWKAENLDLFLGRAWRRGEFSQREAGAWDQLPGDAGIRWAQTIRVTVRDLRSRTFVLAGTPLESPEMPGRQAFPTGAGIYVSSRTLRRGDSYSARVYTPRPSARQLADAGSDYDAWHWRYVSVRQLAPALSSYAGRDVGSEFVFDLWGEDEGIRRLDDLRRGWREGSEILTERPYRGTWELVQRLKRGAANQYEYVKAVEAYLGKGFYYTEQPPAASATIDGFLFETKAGYCQQFSGAMALLLRMGGVPARVAAGFTSGVLDRDTNEYVVRDTDAHSWVEAWFPGYGWVPFDPTPAAAPPTAQGPPGYATAAFGDVRDLGVGQAASDPRLGLAPTAGGGAGIPWLLALVSVGGAALLAWWLVRWRRGRPRGRGMVFELERALARSGLVLGAGTTLAALEQRLHWWPDAVGYVRAISDQRYRDVGAGPTAAQRRALRRALAARGGWPRAWWALPPRVGRRRGR